MKAQSCLAAAASLLTGLAMATSLDSYRIDPNDVSVSGFSAGGFMAAQLGVAYSGPFKSGFGVFAGGPFDCARNQIVTDCALNAVPTIAQPIANMKKWSGHQIDPVANLEHRKIYLQAGTSDGNVGLNPVKKLREQLAHFDDPRKVSFVTTTGAAHIFPTDFDSPGNAPCNASEPPYISNCGYDGAGEVLEWLYGDLKPRNNHRPTGRLSAFYQTGRLGAPGMAPKGYVYVPKSCQSRHMTCKLHVSLHGCPQDVGAIGKTYIDDTGYNKWADTNKIIVLYPQTTPDLTERAIWGGIVLNNPLGCWDWNGYYGEDADQKSGVQMTAIVHQVKQLMGH